MPAKLNSEQLAALHRESAAIHREFGDVLPVATIDACLVEARRRFEEQATVTTWLPVLIGRSARAMLRALVEAQRGGFPV